MRKAIFVISTILVGGLLAGCSTMTPTSYSPYADNNVELRKLEGQTVRINLITDASNFDAGCRLMGPIEASGNRSVAQFVQDSFNDEFKFAGVHGDGVALQADLTKAEFSSTSGLTNGWWELAATLKNPKTGKSLSANSRYEFPSGFDAMTACTQTAQALTPAVQRLVHSAVSNPAFADLVAGE